MKRITDCTMTIAFILSLVGQISSIENIRYQCYLLTYNYTCKRNSKHTKEAYEDTYISLKNYLAIYYNYKCLPTKLKYGRARGLKMEEKMKACLWHEINA